MILYGQDQNYKDQTRTDVIVSCDAVCRWLEWNERNIYVPFVSKI